MYLKFYKKYVNISSIQLSPREENHIWIFVLYFYFFKILRNITRKTPYLSEREKQTTTSLWSSRSEVHIKSPCYIGPFQSIIFHDPCVVLHERNIFDKSRALLNLIYGVALIYISWRKLYIIQWWVAREGRLLCRKFIEGCNASE